jgi:hypothetical protein
MALPGTNVTINDGGLRVERPLAGTRVILLGTTHATNTTIPLNEPVTITSVPLAMDALRNPTGVTNASSKTESELSIALQNALVGGAPAVEVMKIEVAGGLNYTGYSTESRFAALSGAYAALGGHPTDIVVPVGAYAEDILADTWADASGHFTGNVRSDTFVRQLAQFCYEKTKDFDTTIGVIGLKPPLMIPTVIRTGGAVPWAAGVNGVTGDNGILFGTPSLTQVTNWVNYVTGASAGIQAVGWGNYLKGSEATWDTQYLVAGNNGFQAQSSAGLGVTDDLGNRVDVGAYVSVFGAPVKTSNGNVRKLALEFTGSGTNISFNTDGAVNYAGLIANLQPHSSTTNKTVPGLIQSRLLSLSQAEGLANYRVATLMRRSRGLVVVKGITGAYRVDDFTRSDFTNLTTVRITHAAADVVRIAAEPFIGEANNVARRNAMQQNIEGGLRRMQLAGALQSFDFAVISTPDQQVLGEATVDLTIVPVFELQAVKCVVTLAKE